MEVQIHISHTFTTRTTTQDVARGCVGDSLRGMRMDPPTRARAPAAALVRGGATQKTRDHNDRARKRQTSSHSTPRKTYIRKTASRSELPLFDVQSAGRASRQDGRVATPRICENSTAAVLLPQLDRTNRRQLRAERWALHARQLGAVLASCIT